MARMYIVAGYVASGKTTVANRLAEVTGASIIRTDEIRKEFFPLEFDYSGRVPSPSDIMRWLESNDMARTDLQQVLNPLKMLGGAAYRQVVDEYSHMVDVQKEMVYNTAFDRLNGCLSAGRDAIFDATFSRKELRERVYRIARRNMVKGIYIMQVVCGEGAVKRRLAARRRRPPGRVVSNAKQLDVYRAIKREFDESRIEDDSAGEIALRRLVYHTDTHAMEMHGEPDEVTELIRDRVLCHLKSRFGPKPRS